MQPGPALAETLMVIARTAQDLIGPAMRHARPDSHPAIHLLFNWVVGVARRFAHILATPYVAPLPRPGRPARPATPSARALAVAIPGQPAPTLRTWRWLVRALGINTPYATVTQFTQFLRDPAIAELLARDPRAVRLLRGMCRRFAIQRQPDLPPILFARPRRRVRPRPAAPASRLRDPRPIIERTAVCPDTGRRTFVPWTAELAEYRLLYAARCPSSREKAAIPR